MEIDLFHKIKNKLIYEIQLAWLLWIKSREFKDDPNNRINLVEKGFFNQRSESVNDGKVISRIIESYNKAKEFHKKAPASFQVSNEWIPIYEKYMGEVERALFKRDADKLLHIYGNFMRNPCSSGLHGLPVDMEKIYFHGKMQRKYKKLFLYDSLHRYKLWKSLLGNTNCIEDLDSPLIGNPYGYYIDGRFIKEGSDYLHYYATLIRRLTRGKKHQIVLELDGGYGGMAYYLIRDQHNISYIDFDLPENMALAAYYLLKSFPEKNILLYGEAELNLENISKNDLILMPNFEITKLPDQSIDLGFNSYYLAEMSIDAIHTYISEFTRLIKGYFLHVNHNKSALVTADNFNINPKDFDLLYKIPAFWNAGRNLNMDEYEYLYKRINDNY